jgi:alkylhydroperoxidase family enzyme
MSAASQRTVGTAPELYTLVRTYVSYLSGCDACVMESLRAAGAADADLSRLYRLSTWRRAPLRTYTERERIALVWAEVVALLGEEGVGEALRRQAEEHFRAEELDDLTRVVTGTRGHRRLMLERAGVVPSGRRRGNACPVRENRDTCAAPR